MKTSDQSKATADVKKDMNHYHRWIGLFAVTVGLENRDRYPSIQIKY